MSEWQPIDTAPKDGTRVLTCWECGKCPPSVMHWYNGGWRQQSHGSMNKPSHWMPLPAPPAPPADPVELLREAVRVSQVSQGDSERRVQWAKRARDFLAAHDAREGGGE